MGTDHSSETRVMNKLLYICSTLLKSSEFNFKHQVTNLIARQQHTI